VTGYNKLEKLETGIPGFELISFGGLPKGRTTLLAGSAGSTKTLMAAQFLAEGIKQYNQPGIFVSFEESPDDIITNMKGFGWDIQKWISEGKWLFVDASPQSDQETIELKNYDLGGLMARIEYAVNKIKASRLVLDSLGAIFSQFCQPDIIRKELFRLTNGFKALGVTGLLTAERIEEYGPISRHDVEEFVTDNVVILRNSLEDEKRRRTIEILKYRGADHQKGEFPFTIVSERGIEIIPLSAMELKQKSSKSRIQSGNPDLDKMCGGGFFRDSIILASGATGTGKTLLVTEFINGGAKNDEKSILFAFEESRDQLFRNATGWGVDFERYEREGLLKVVCEYPETMGLEDHLIRMKRIIRKFKPNRVAVDSLSALERVSTIKGFREFVIGLTSFVKESETAGLVTSTTANLLGGTSITEAHISTITDSIILLRYVELAGEMRRGMTVLKMRGSFHDKNIVEYTIDNKGMKMGKAFRNVSGILTGYPVNAPADELERLSGMFDPESG